jgi:polysaccharide deacetylase 2 family uncharacterized protein YibQ
MTQNEADIRVQFNRAVLARRNGSAIAIGHPHPSTVSCNRCCRPAFRYHAGAPERPAE